MGPGTAPNPWSVTATTDNAPLTATISISGGDPSSVLTTASIDVVFNKPVRIESVTYSITPFVSGSLQWDGSEQRATFTHDRFQVGQTYTFAIPSAADAAGNPLSTAVELTFTVGSTTYTHLPHIGPAGD